jgi:pyruvate/2-oxoglutarate dehydrogenase complex dihydrolipoamide acyltransferase (E2) component
MPADILMPALSPAMEKGDLAMWLERVGYIPPIVDPPAR